MNASLSSTIRLCMSRLLGLAAEETCRDPALRCMLLCKRLLLLWLWQGLAGDWAINRSLEWSGLSLILRKTGIISSADQFYMVICRATPQTGSQAPLQLGDGHQAPWHGSAGIHCSFHQNSLRRNPTSFTRSMQTCLVKSLCLSSFFLFPFHLSATSGVDHII